jgi:signal transduction histidine kinase
MSKKDANAEMFTSVLLVEDEPAHAMLIMRALAKLTGEIVHVSTKKEALETMHREYFELLICDLNLPDASGIDVLKAALVLRPNLPTIVLTSSNSIDDAISAMREGAWDYMVKDFTGKFEQRFAFVLDRILKRQHLEQRELQLRIERDAFYSASYSAQDGLAILSEQGNIIFCNQAFDKFCSLFDIKKDKELISIIDVLAEADQRIAKDLASHLLPSESESMWTSELLVKPTETSRVDEPCYFELNLTATLSGRFKEDTSGVKIPKFSHYVLWVRDISRRKQQEQFQRDLLVTTTHDLKGPLGAILTSVDILEENPKITDLRAKEIITRIASCARNSVTIIDELLSVRRIQDGMLSISPRFHNVAEIIEDAVNDFEPVAKSKSVNLSYAISENDLKVYVDRVGLLRVIENLLSNAIKFTKSGGKVSVSANRIGNETVITVEDSGTGISVDERHQLFERFTRLEKHHEMEGTGLGLFVVRSIVDAHNGRVELKSEVGVGSKFVIYLPDKTEN